MRTFRITVDGTPYLVSVEELDATDPATTAAAPPAARTPAPAPPAAVSTAPVAVSRTEAASPSGAGVGSVVASPLAGTVVSVDVSIGQTVKQGQPVLVLEAMKMNTHVTASRGGTVTAIHVAAGATVAEGQALLAIG